MISITLSASYRFFARVKEYPCWYEILRFVGGRTLEHYNSVS